MTVGDGEGEVDLAVEVFGCGERPEPRCGVGERADGGGEVGDGEGVTVDIGEPLKEISGLDGVDDVFLPCGEGSGSACEERRVVNRSE